MPPNSPAYIGTAKFLPDIIKSKDLLIHARTKSLGIYFLLNNNVLMVSVTLIYSPYATYRFAQSVAQDFNLGLEAMPSIPDYWD